MSDFFCPAPWRSIYQHVNKTAVCCISTKRLDMSPEEFLKSKYLADLKETVLKGEVDETCLPCRRLEQAGLQSIRLHQLRQFGRNIEEKLDYMELRASNLCNFECIMCNASSSSLIAKEVYTITDDNWQQVLNLAKNIGHINLTGGEPMLIKHYYELLDFLIDLGKVHTIISIYTNASVYNPKFIEKLLNFKNIRLNLSIDAVGQTAEQQRKGTDWNVVSENVQKYLELPARIMFHSSFTKISLKDISSLAKYYSELVKTHSKCNFQAHTVLTPHNVSINSSSAEEAATIVESINDALNYLIDPKFNQLVKQLTSYKTLLETRM